MADRIPAAYGRPMARTLRHACRLALGALVLAGVAAPPALAGPQRSKVHTLARDHQAADAALARVKAIRTGRGTAGGRALTPALAQLSARYDALDAGERREAARLLARPTDGAADPHGDGYTVAEHEPSCTAHFCFHWVTTTADAPDLTDGDTDGVPDYVEQMAAEFEFVRTRENGDLGWRAPVGDGTRGEPAGGGADRLDVYVAELAGSGALGYAATDAGQAGDQHVKSGYMVMDDNYTDTPGKVPLDLLRVTAAHEYNHILQFAYDALEDTWMFESTAVWMEDLVYDAVDDYRAFLPGWVTLDQVPLAKDQQDKHYGSAVWNMWLDARHGPGLIREA